MREQDSPRRHGDTEGKGAREFVNAHTHVYSGLAPFGMPAPAEPPRNFVGILEKIWWRLDRALDEKSLRVSARYYMAEARAAGTTTLIDHHESPNFIEGSLDVLADAATEIGIRLVTCYGATERNSGRDEARRGLRECARFIRANRRPNVRGMVGLHASFTVSDETIREAGELARELGVGVHVHVAEDIADVDDARGRGFQGPLERLLTLGGLPPGSILAHGVHLDRVQVEAAAIAGCWLIQNPRSNEANRVGYPRALAASDNIALGTDGFPSDMRAEFDALKRLARGNEADRATPESNLAGRLEAGTTLAATLFGEPLPSIAAPTLTAGTLAAIESDARAEAERLWAKW